MPAPSQPLARLIMAENFDDACATIAQEYERLCRALNLVPLWLDVYLVDESPSTAELPLRDSGVDPRNTDARYSGSRRVLVMPIGSGDIENVTDLDPPSTWAKLSPDWPAWRIDLWHEVVHQYSHVVLGRWDPKESGLRRLDDSFSTTGHGLGWRAAIEQVASHFGVDADTLDTLLDGNERWKPPHTKLRGR
jgi:hypothetical protein